MQFINRCVQLSSSFIWFVAVPLSPFRFVAAFVAVLTNGCRPFDLCLVAVLTTLVAVLDLSLFWLSPFRLVAILTCILSNSCNMPVCAIPLNVYQHYDAHVSIVANKSQISFRLLKSSKSPPFHSQQLPPANRVMSLHKCTYVRTYEFFKTSFIQTYYALHS